ncbi:chitin deacetylase [Candida albicans P34048]|nr:chitin deacetylase [Candida albicans P34048]KGU22290.1 chitin deacetylase [Candida albicans P57055]KGU23641.1 chitin deacetylase [Candida albicans P75063]
MITWLVFYLMLTIPMINGSDLSLRLQSKFMPTSFSPRNIFDTHGPATINSNKEDSSSSSGGGGGSGLPPSPMQFPPKLPFPKWLSDFTGLHEWPDLDPPYIPLDFIDFNKIVNIPIHKQGQCHDTGSNNNNNLTPLSILRTPKACSFDCFNCVEIDDVYTCPKLSQTFDDGPSTSTLKLLQSFNQTGLKTTLFTLGVNIVRFPEIYQQSHSMGHIMGSHTWSHKFLPSLTNQEIISQIEWSIWAMNATSNHLPKWFRPPYGGIDNRIRSILRQFGMQAVLWDFDTFDWKMLGGGGGGGTSNIRKEEDVFSEVEKFKLTKNNKGLILHHDAIQKTVDVGIMIHEKLLNHDQLTVPLCVGGIDYIKTFPK